MKMTTITITNVNRTNIKSVVGFGHVDRYNITCLAYIDVAYSKKI